VWRLQRQSLYVGVQSAFDVMWKKLLMMMMTMTMTVMMVKSESSIIQGD